MKRITLCAVILAILLTSGCGRNSPLAKDLKRYTTSGPKEHAKGQPSKNLTSIDYLPVRTLNNTEYVSLYDFTQITGFQGKWLPDGSYGVGDHDPHWSFRPAENTARSGSQKVELPAAVLRQDNQLYIPVSGLQQMFGDVAVFIVYPGSVVFPPRTSSKDKRTNGENRIFADHPSEHPTPKQPGNTFSAASTNADTLLAFAKNYLGVKYDFGAGSYQETGRFDCSSFVRYVFDRFGVAMPRTAREQAQQGRLVSRSDLHRGDLLFFYVPGRFKSDQTIGHVGIYMGDGQMIHSSPKPENGVQVTSINKPYWQETFLQARRYL